MASCEINTNSGAEWFSSRLAKCKLITTESVRRSSKLAQSADVSTMQYGFERRSEDDTRGNKMNYRQHWEA